MDWRTLDRLKEAFEESDLPMRVDVLDWHAISDSFRKVVERDYVILREEGTTHTLAPRWSESLGATLQLWNMANRSVATTPQQGITGSMVPMGQSAGIVNLSVPMQV